MSLSEIFERNKERFNRPKRQWENIIIPFFRRWLIPSQRDKTIEEIKNGLEIPQDYLKLLKRENKKWKIRKVKVKSLVLQVVHDSVHGRNKFKTNEVIKKVIREEFLLEFPDLEGIKMKAIERESYIVQMDDGKVFFNEIKDNYYEGFHESDLICKFEFFLQPNGSSWKMIDLLKFKRNIFREIDALILDPPWPLNSKNPVRTPAISYDVPSLKEIFNINGIEDFKKKEGYLGKKFNSSQSIKMVNEKRL